MGFFDRFFKSTPPTPPPIAAEKPAPQLPQVPDRLPRITASSAAEVCKHWKLQPTAEASLTGAQTPSQFLGVLQEKELGDDMVKFLAYGLPDRDGVAWAIECIAKLSQEQMAPADAQALRTAQAWVESPTEANRAVAAAAAAKTDFQNPSAWAAQAAAWAQAGAPSPASKAAPPPQRLAPHAIAGCVLLAATKTPGEERGTFRAQYPFIAMGLARARGGSAQP